MIAHDARQSDLLVGRISETSGVVEKKTHDRAIARIVERDDGDVGPPSAKCPAQCQT